MPPVSQPDAHRARTTAYRVLAVALPLVGTACLAPLPESGCDSNQDCASGWLCVSSVCRQLCDGNDDCTTGTCVVEGYCVPEGEGTCECRDPGPCEVSEGASCNANGCIYPKRRCAQPPAPECVNGDATYRTYSDVGTCEPGTGECMYAMREVSCPDCTATCMGRCQDHCSDAQGGCRLTAFCMPEDPPRCDLELAADGRFCSLPDGGTGRCDAQPGYGISSFCRTWQYSHTG